MSQSGDEFYLGLLDELAELHVRKSEGYGTGDDPLANFTAIAWLSGEPAWRYPRRRALEKLARIESLEAQGRIGELEEEHLDVASLLLCAEALRRRMAHGSAEPRLQTASSGTDGSPSELVTPYGESRVSSSRHPETGLCSADATTLFAERLRELAALVSTAVPVVNGRLSLDELIEIEAALRTSADLIGPEALAEGPYVAPCAQERGATSVVHAAHTPCKSPVFRSDQAVAEMLSRRLGAADREEYERRRTASAVAGDEPARLRDAQRGDDGRVRSVTATALTELIAVAERDERLWSVLAEHRDGRLELHSWNGSAGTIADSGSVNPDWLLTGEPVVCSEFAAAGLDVLNECERCDPFAGEQQGAS